MESWADVYTFGEVKRTWLKRLLNRPVVTPSHDTFGRVLARLDPVAFQAGFSRGIGAVPERPAMAQDDSGCGRLVVSATFAQSPELPHFGYLRLVAPGMGELIRWF